MFASYVCNGDSFTVERDGFDFTVRLEYDVDASPDDFECYTAEQIDAWKRDEWFFGGIVVSVSRNGIPLHEHAASLWGIDCNFPGSDNAYLNEVAEDLLQEALPVAQAALEDVRRKLA